MKNNNVFCRISTEKSRVQYRFEGLQLVTHFSEWMIGTFGAVFLDRVIHIVEEDAVVCTAV